MKRGEVVNSMLKLSKEMKERKDKIEGMLKRNVKILEGLLTLENKNYKIEAVISSLQEIINNLL